MWILRIKAPYSSGKWTHIVVKIRIINKKFKLIFDNITKIINLITKINNGKYDIWQNIM